MLEQYKKNTRVIFPKNGIQKNFILKSKKKLGLTLFKLAEKIEVNPRTIADWSREKYKISYIHAQKLSRLAQVPIPQRYKLILWENHLKKIGKMGGKARIKLYGKVAPNEEYRKVKWKEWWVRVGKYRENPKNFQSLLKIKIPDKSEKLAEFTGIMLGDGGIAPYHIHITLSNKEGEYAKYVSKMITILFGLAPKLYKLEYAEAVKLVVARKLLVDFCQEIGLVKGNKVKRQVDVPDWIKENKSFSKACVRGLIDTDGCFYENSYMVNRKKYSYLKIAFISASKPIIFSVAKILRSVGIKVIINKNYKDLRIVDIKYVLKYIEKIGSHNQKHLGKIKKWKSMMSGA